MKFLQNIKNSIYSPSYYQELLTKRFSYSLKYYLLLALLMAAVITGVLSFTFVPKAKVFIETLGPKIVSGYPEELAITVDKGKVSTNVEEPYYIRMPESLKSNDDFDVNGEKMEKFENLLVIDTKSNFSVEQFLSYKTFALLTENALVTANNEQISIQPIDSNVDFYLDKTVLAMYAGKLQSFMKFVTPVLIVGIFVGGFLLSTSKLLYLLLGALIIWLIAKIKKMDIKYSKAYQLGLHLMTLGVILSPILMFLGISGKIPFLFTIILVVLAMVNLKKPDPVSPMSAIQ